ncbi:MAG: sigma-54 dependent transcriptional regulator [Blastocatellia bacterium]|nr:sigma-54 dependent transcriptional regulator [Blastocatellia bacterium]
MKKILIVDDDPETCEFLTELFSVEDWSVQTALSAGRALELLEREDFDCVIADLNLNEAQTGLDVLRAFKTRSPQTEVILITGFGTLEAAVEALRSGAFDFISKPFKVEDVLETVRRALRLHEPVREESALQRLLEPYEASGLIGRTPQMIELYKEIARVAPTLSTVLIVGESGTGKELIARAIHTHSARAHGPFIAVNCGALTETLLEAELFGHARGSFTGAVADKKGLFEEADGGTLFLDEISETTPALQVKLLRALQEGEIKRVGETRTRRVDVRVIAATNRDLEEEVKAGRFREDLYYRLSVVTLRVPPLRERREDIPLLATHFLRRATQQTGQVLAFSPAALALLKAYSWPGNVRELENSIEYAVIHARGGLIVPEDLPEKIRVAVPSPRQGHASASLEATLFHDLPSLDELERRYLLYVLEAVHGNRSRAAEILGIDRRTLYRMAERFGIPLERTSADS